jgi:predicted RNA binding protein YcfA (HicA-like mRNA interferase family)
MSPKLPRVTAAELRRALRRDGWVEIRQTGSHVVLEHPAKPGLVVVPRHRGTLHPGTIAAALRQAGLTAEDLINLL